MIFKVNPCGCEPIGNQVIIRLDRKAELSGGLIIPDSARQGDSEWLELGEVVAVGPGYLTDKGERGQMTVRVGDRVGYYPMSRSGPVGREVPVEDKDETYVLCQENQLAFILRGGSVTPGSTSPGA